MAALDRWDPRQQFAERDETTVSCGHCGAHLTADYVRVFAPDDAETVECCPNCPDRVRAGDGVREAKSQRGGSRGRGGGA